MGREKHRQQFHVCFLGGFSIRCGESCLSWQDHRAKQVWMLLEYLLLHRTQAIETTELENILWQEGEIDKPSNALKNLIYRLRCLMKEAGFDDECQYIISKRGTYAWNPQINCKVDVEEFEKQYQRACDETAEEEGRMESCRKAIALYRGDFLRGETFEAWAVLEMSRYRRMFFECVKLLCTLLEARGQQAEVEQICAKAIEIDPFAEEFRLKKMEAMVKQGKLSEALEEYQKTTELYYRELGIEPTENIRRMYGEISKQRQNTESDLLSIKEKLRGMTQNQGAFCCDYEIFKNMYQVEARTVERSGQSVYVCLFTLGCAERALPKKSRERAMEALKESLISCLRRGDVIARYSATQYVALLPTLTEETSVFVIKRIKRSFSAVCGLKKVSLETQALPLDPAE